MMGSALLLLLTTVVSCVGSSHFYWDYIVVGAGPAGLQLGHFLQEAGRDYVLLEKANVSGSFYTQFPRHDRLISINKRNTGKTNKEFNMRHDWNSLLTDDETLQMRHYTRQFFPHRESLVRYLNDFQRKLNIRVQYNTEVSRVRRVHNASSDTYTFTMADQRGNTYTCRTLVLATGMGKANLPTFQGSEYTESYDDISTDPEDYEGQTVLILGRGNSAFEVADSIYGATNLIHMLGRSRVRLSWATHYVGDLRAVNNNLLDTYQLKSLDGILEAPVEDVRITKHGNKFRVELVDPNNSRSLLGASDVPRSDIFDNFALRDSYDRVIRCLGWQFDESLMEDDNSIRRGTGRTKKYPALRPNYESESVPGLFFAGTNSHGIDHRISSGGFIHGFRYTVKSLFHLLEWRNHQTAWPSFRGPIDQLINAIVKRINEASAPYQMFNILGDVIAIRNNGAEFEFYEQFPMRLLADFSRHTGHQVDRIIVLSMEYGANFSGAGKDTFRADRAVGEPMEAHKSNFLHPVLYYYRQLPTEADFEARTPGSLLPRPARLHHMVEDFLTLWEAPKSHILPLRRFLETVVNEDLRSFFAEDCMKLALAFQRLPRHCEQLYLRGQGVLGTEELLNAANSASLLL